MTRDELLWWADRLAGIAGRCEADSARHGRLPDSALDYIRTIREAAEDCRLKAQAKAAG